MSATDAVVDLDADLEEDGEEGGRGRLMMIVAAVLVLLVGAAVWWFVLADHEPAPPADGEVVVLPSLTTTTGSATLRHARISMGIVLVEGQDPDVLGLRAPLLQDALLREIALMDADTLRSGEGSDQLRRALTADAIDIWGEEVVRRVILTELLVQ